MDKNEIKKYWYSVGDEHLKKTIGECQLIIESKKYAKDIIELVVSTQLMLLGILKERDLLV